MMGRLESSQDRFFYDFCLDDVVPSDHLVRRIDAVLDLSWLHGELDGNVPIFVEIREAGIAG